MNQEWREQLASAGIDVDSALERFMGNEGLLERFMKKFLADPTFAALEEAVAGGDPAGALTASHTLKGMCGNLSFTGLYALFTRQVELLRGDDFPGAAAMMPEIRQAYGLVTDTIRRCWP